MILAVNDGLSGAGALVVIGQPVAQIGETIERQVGVVEAEAIDDDRRMRGRQLRAPLGGISS